MKARPQWLFLLKPIAVLSKASGRNDRFITKKRPHGQFPIVPYKQLIDGQIEQFLEKAGETSQPQWPLYQGRGPGHMARSLDLGCGWPISYCPRTSSLSTARVFTLSDRPAVAAALSRPRRPVAAMAVLSTRSGHISRYGLRMADFILPRTSSLPTAKSSHF